MAPVTRSSSVSSSGGCGSHDTSLKKKKSRKFMKKAPMPEIVISDYEIQQQKNIFERMSIFNN